MSSCLSVLTAPTEWAINHTNDEGRSRLTQFIATLPLISSIFLSAASFRLAHRYAAELNVRPSVIDNHELDTETEQHHGAAARVRGRGRRLFSKLESNVRSTRNITRIATIAIGLVCAAIAATASYPLAALVGGITVLVLLGQELHSRSVEHYAHSYAVRNAHLA